MTAPAVIPLFPLHTVLFPGGPLPLRIFETRYVDMVRRCMREATPFGVVLIEDGDEAGGGAAPPARGCRARGGGFAPPKDGVFRSSRGRGPKVRVRPRRAPARGPNL